MLNDKQWVKAAYAKGVPMGGDLPPDQAGKPPSFLVWAVKDPDDGNLDRIQIIKGWTKQGQIFEKVFDVAWSGDRKADPQTGKVPPVGNTVDIKSASYKNTIGATELKKAGSILNSIRVSTHFTMPVSFKSRLPAGRLMMQRNWASRR
jgi:Protein of unknown function (DUF3604).